MAKIALQYRIVWKRQGDRHPRTKMFARAHYAHAFLVRLGTKTPWKTMGKNRLRRASMVLARMLGVPVEELLKRPIRETVLAISDANKPIEWLRVEMRQVMPWTEVGDPLLTLRPKTFDKTERKAEAFCDLLDQDPAGERYYGVGDGDTERRQS